MIFHLAARLFLPLVSALSILSVGAVAAGQALQSDELSFYGRAAGSFDLFLVDVNREVLVNLTHSTLEEIRPAWSPDGTRLAYFATQHLSQDSRLENDLYMMDFNTRQIRELAISTPSESYPTWSPDGRYVAFPAAERGKVGVSIIDVRDGALQRLADVRPSLLSWSPDGAHIAFMADCDFNCDIYVMDADGTDIRAMTKNGVFDVFPAWSPDGKRIAFMSNRDRFFELYQVDVRCTDCNRETQRLTDNRDFDGFPVWSPDGRTLLFSSEREGNFDLYALDMGCVETGDACEPQARRLTDHPARDLSPAWSPDGSRIAYISGRGIYVMDADGGDVRWVADNVLPDQFLAWRPGR